MSSVNHKSIGFLKETGLYLKYFPRYAKSYVGRKVRFHKASKFRKLILQERDRIQEAIPDVGSTLDYLEKHKRLTVYNADFENECKPFTTPVYYDDSVKLKYVLIDGKRLFYPSSYSNRHIQYWFNSVCWEQDKNSPHRYLDSNEELKDAVLFDCGSAEGNLPIMHIENLKHAYLFEGDSCWLNPLETTFSPWKEKVTVVNRFLGSGNGMLSLGQYIEKLLADGELDVEDKIFIKMDVEGFEPDLMKDLTPVLNKLKNVRLAVCVYHKQNEEAEVISCIPDGFSYKTRQGYMIFYSYEDGYIFPYFRHGLLVIERN